MRAIGERARVAERARGAVGLLYALNTLGAVVGTLATGFVLIEVLGLSTSMRLTGVTNLGIGALVYVRAARHMRAGDGAPPEEAVPEDRRAFALLRVLVGVPAGRYAVAGLFVSGATVMLYEVVFTRVLGLVFGVSSYAFSISGRKRSSTHSPTAPASVETAGIPRDRASAMAMP